MVKALTASAVGEGLILGPVTTTTCRVAPPKDKNEKRKPRLAHKGALTQNSCQVSPTPLIEKRSQEGALAGHLVTLNKISMSDCEEGRARWILSG